MISAINIHNFKIHKDSDIELSPLTIFTGINGMGKSSVTQAMLMLRDCVTCNDYPRALKLKGRSYDVGDRFGNLVNWFVEKDADKLRIKLKSEQKEFIFEFEYQLDNVTEIPLYSGSKIYDIKELESVSLFNKSFQYLSAFRFGPKSIYNGDTLAINNKQVSLSNGSGEYAVAILDRYGNEPIEIKSMALPFDDGTINYNLGVQAALWLNRVSPDVQLAIDVDGNNYMLNYSYPGPNGRRKVSPLNTGFGISYLLSVIVALLISHEKSTVIIENPEAHIHPAAQSSLMHLVSLAVKGGAQVIIETHSDHIIFGALVNMKQNVISGKDLKIHHFDRNVSTGELEITPVKIGRDCRIKNAPRNFVEQMNLDLDILFDE